MSKKADKNKKKTGLWFKSRTCPAQTHKQMQYTPWYDNHRSFNLLSDYNGKWRCLILALQLNKNVIFFKLGDDLF